MTPRASRTRSAAAPGRRSSGGLTKDTDLVTARHRRRTDFDLFSNLTGLCPRLRGDEPTGDPLPGGRSQAPAPTRCCGTPRRIKARVAATIRGIRSARPTPASWSSTTRGSRRPRAACPRLLPLADGDYRWAARRQRPPERLGARRRRPDRRRVRRPVRRQRRPRRSAPTDPWVNGRKTRAGHRAGLSPAGRASSARSADLGAVVESADPPASTAGSARDRRRTKRRRTQARGLPPGPLPFPLPFARSRCRDRCPGGCRSVAAGCRVRGAGSAGSAAGAGSGAGRVVLGRRVRGRGRRGCGRDRLPRWCGASVARSAPGWARPRSPRPPTARSTRWPVRRGSSEGVSPAGANEHPPRRPRRTAPCRRRPARRRSRRARPTRRADCAFRT